MILNQRFKNPVISFGLGLTMLSCEVGDDVTIWQNEVYNENEFFIQQNEVEQIFVFRFYFGHADQ